MAEDVLGEGARGEAASGGEGGQGGEFGVPAAQAARLVAGAWPLGEACPASFGRYSRAVAIIPLEAEL